MPGTGDRTRSHMTLWHNAHAQHTQLETESEIMAAYTELGSNVANGYWEMLAQDT